MPWMAGRPTREEEVEDLKEHIEMLKEELKAAEEELKELESLNIW
jgi:predicted  nucleic acid-binding Zn-ribbon protein